MCDGLLEFTPGMYLQVLFCPEWLLFISDDYKTKKSSDMIKSIDVPPCCLFEKRDELSERTILHRIRVHFMAAFLIWLHDSVESHCRVELVEAQSGTPKNQTVAVSITTVDLYISRGKTLGN